MILLGIAFVLFGVLEHYTGLGVYGAAIVVGAGAITLGLIMGERLGK